MSRNIYGPVNGERKAAKHIYGPVNGARKKVIKVYGSVNGARKLMWQEIPHIDNVVNGTVEFVDPDGFTTWAEGYCMPGGDSTGHVLFISWTEDILPTPKKYMILDGNTRVYWPAGFPFSDYFNYTVDTYPLQFEVSWVR